MHETEELQIGYVEAYDQIWKDRGSGAKLDVSFWRPTPPKGWKRVGHHAKRGYAFPTESTMVLRAKADDVLQPPAAYSRVWNDAGSGVKGNVSIWRPICPSGYKALGHVANSGYGEPARSEVVCVKSTVLERALPGAFIWDDKGSGAKRDFSAWGIQGPAPHSNHIFSTRGLFYGARAHFRPEQQTVDVLWAVKAKETDDPKRARLMSAELLFDYTQVFEQVWTDAESGAKADVSFLKPIPRSGYHAVGHYAFASHQLPRDAVVMVVKEKKPGAGALAVPLNYEKVWTDAGSGAKRDAAVWRPSCPSNYVALGLVATRGAKPSTTDVRCVRRDLTVQAGVGEVIWTDSGSGAHRDFSAWPIEPDNAPPGQAYVSPGTFIGHASHAKVGTKHARALKLELPLREPPRSLPIPQLRSYEKPSLFEETAVTSVVYLPFVAVHDPAWSQTRRAKDSPYYRLVRTDRYQLVNHAHNETDLDQNKSWSYSVALSNSKSFTHQVGVSLTNTWTNKPLGVGGSVSVTAHYSFTYQQSSGRKETTTISVPVKVPPGKAVAAYAVHSKFRLYRADGSAVVDTSVETNEPNSHVWVQYPPREQ